MSRRDQHVPPVDDGVHANAAGTQSNDLSIPFPALAARMQTSPLPVPLQNPALLPLSDLDPEVLERLVAEIVYRQDNRSVQFYGRRGQKQFGLDIVERNNTGAHTVYQVKRYQELRPDAIAKAIKEFAGPARDPEFHGEPRRFNPVRFVLATSALLDSDTGNVNALEQLQREYNGDLDIDVWGAETLGRKLRDAPHLVYAVFGPEWAEAWCGFEPAPAPPGAPRPLALVEEPIEVLGLGSMVADAEELELNDPSAAANLFATVAVKLEGHNFPGHAALMRRRQSTAARASGALDEAFDVSWQLALEQVLRGAKLASIAGHELDNLVTQLSPLQQAKWTILKSIAGWYEFGSDLTTIVPALTTVTTAKDPDAAVLCCLALERAVVDGLQEHDPPFTLVGNPDSETPRLLAELRDLADGCDSPKPDLRARLRCAVADASLTSNATSTDVDSAFNQLVNDALAGRYLDARGLVASRAAYQFAVHGDVDRAETLWRQSVLGSSESGLYGDVRNALRASRLLRADHGMLPLTGLDVVTAALPNRRQLLAGPTDATLLALEAAQRGKLINAFGNSRRDLWEARIAGHLQEELIALRLFGDVLLASEHPDGALECYVLAGDSKKALATARSLTTPVDVSRWLTSPLRRRRATAIQALGAQARLIPDTDVPTVIRMLVAEITAAWQVSRLPPVPEHDAIRAIAKFGYRIPAEAVKPLLELATPARSSPTVLSDDIARVLIEAYWAVPARRSEIATALLEMLQLQQPPHDLWGLVQDLPDTAREPMFETIRVLAADGNGNAIETLAMWGEASEVVQLAARRACAALLRKPVGVDRTQSAVGTQEAVTARLLECLLRAEHEVPIETEALVASLSRPPGGVMFYTQDVIEHSARESEKPGTVESHDTPDNAAVVAAGPRDALAAEVASHLLALAMDKKEIAGPRLSALHALRKLLPYLPRSLNNELARTLLQLHQAPSLTKHDKWEIETNVPLSKVKIDTGAKSLSPIALVAAAEAFAHHRDTATAASDDETTFAWQLVAAAIPLLQAGNDQARIGAAAVTAIASASPTFSHHAISLVLHPDDLVRSLGAAHAPADEQLFAQLVTDRSSAVRREVAARGRELDRNLRDILENDPSVSVRRTLQAALTEASN